MDQSAHIHFSDALVRIAGEIDLTEAQYKQVYETYAALTEFLESEKSILHKYSPQLLSQGSIRLGTAVRPIGEEGEFDVDITLKLNIALPETQQFVKKEVERQLKSDANYAEKLEEKQRCWRLLYAKSSKFHVDIVPAVPQDYQWLLASGIPEGYARYAICITDNSRPNYDVRTSDWPKSNTEGFALWFLDVMKVQADAIRTNLQKSLMLERAEDVPQYKVRTPLQLAIQIFKRHRDVMFKDEKYQKDKPASIIITTLVAKSYATMFQQGTLPRDFSDLLLALLEQIPTLILTKNGETRIENPVDTSENFADRWKKPNRKKYFYDWIERAKQDFTQALRKGDIQTGLDYLKNALGARTVNEAIKAMTGGGSAIVLSESTGAPMQFDVSYKQKPLWPMNVTGNVTITGQYKGRTSFNYFDLNQDILPTHYDLVFTAQLDPEISGNYDVFWQVVNTGQEAAQANGLRGEIFPAKHYGRGGLRHSENTLYSGAHWIQCDIVQDGVCIAKSNEYIVRIK